MGGMTLLEIVLLSMTAGLVFLLGLCWTGHFRRKRAAQSLHAQIEKFLNGEIESPAFSVRDNDFAQFENAVIELETRLLNCRENQAEERRRNVEMILDISHQLKTPLAGLRLFCEMDGAAHQNEQLMLLQRMEDLIRSLLQLYQIRSEGYAFHYQDRSLRPIAEEARANVSALFPSRRIEITGNAMLRMDAHWLREALVNLIKNSCEHTGENGIIIVHMKQDDRAAWITVQDDGGGVPEDEVHSLFRRFFKSSTSTSREGVGVGLAIVQAIIERHHGTIAADNENGGLKISIYLPNFQGLLKKT